MNSATAIVTGLPFAAWRRQATSLVGPIAFVLILAMVVVPLPRLALDFLFTFNICFGLMILLAALYTAKATDFAAFPTLLLMTTLLRLSLNVAAARIILLDGYMGADAAGRVIESFGAFVVGGNYAVGIAVFAILVIINFVVITKGAGRIAEVAARFVLDGMPGKQMAIDADLNAGLINQEEATRRRQEVGREADFFGAMDGASKFVRGDAVAAVLILFINLVGGLIIGIWQHELSLAEAAQTYTLLTIGDGLVAQISGAGDLVGGRCHRQPGRHRRRCQQARSSRNLPDIRMPGGLPPALSGCPGSSRACRICPSSSSPALLGTAGWLVRREQARADASIGRGAASADRSRGNRYRRCRTGRAARSAAWLSAGRAGRHGSATAVCCAGCARCDGRCRAISVFWCRSCMSATTPICDRPATAS